MDLKVITLNLHKGFSALNRKFILPELREAIRASSADLVLLQEVQGKNIRHASSFTNWPDAPQYEFLADSIWPDFAYAQNSSYPEGHHGNAILSKFPILSQESLGLYCSRFEQKGLLHCTISPKPGFSIHVICIHMGLFKVHRRKHMEEIMNFIEDRIPKAESIIMAGDFNDWDLDAHRKFRRDFSLIEAFESTRGQLPKTFPAIYPLLSLDRIYVRNISVVEAKALSGKPWQRLSDHIAISARLRSR